MRVVVFCHSLVSDWNHGNAHFLRGVVAELAGRGHDVRVFEPRAGWSRANLLREHGEEALGAVRAAFPGIRSVEYDLHDIDLDAALDGADLVLVHEWSDRGLVARIGERRARAGAGFRLLFHDTHHRAATQPQEMAAFDLRHFDGVLAFGEVIRRLYLERGWAERAWTWHEAADTRVFSPLAGDGAGGDLVWIGNWGDGERTRELRTFLLDPARRLRLRGTIHGVRYPRRARFAIRRAGLRYRGWLANHLAPLAFARHRVTVHVPRRPYVEALPGIPTIRPFEAMACGIPLVCSPWEDVEGLFRGGEDHLVARDGGEMAAHLHAILHDEALAGSLRASGLETIRTRHTCAHRVDELLAVAGELGLAERGPPAPGGPPSARGGPPPAPAAVPGSAPRRAGGRRAMRFAFFGSSLVSSKWNGSCTYYRGMIRGLHARGHETVFYEPIAYGRQEQRDIEDPSWARVVIYRAETEDQVLATVESARGGFDVVVKTSGVGVHDHLLEQAVLDLDAPTTIFWDVDAPATLGEMEARADHPLLRRIGDFDLVLTYGGGAPVVRRYEAAGARECIPVYNALDPTTHHPVPPRSDLRADLAFLGNRLPDREARVEEFFFRALDLLPERSFLLGGSGWGDHRMPENLRYLGHVSTRDHNALNSSPLAVLNISRQSMAANGFSPATRVFEAAGAGACLITDAWEGVELFLEPGSEVLVAADGAQVAALLAGLDRPRAARIGAAARRRVLEQHTYAHRAEQVEAILEGRTAGAAA